MSTMTIEDLAPAPRMKAADRRELILEAATAVFGAKTYVGTTTDERGASDEVRPRNLPR